MRAVSVENDLIFESFHRVQQMTSKLSHTSDPKTVEYIWMYLFESSVYFYFRL